MAYFKTGRICYPENRRSTVMTLKAGMFLPYLMLVYNILDLGVWWYATNMAGKEWWFGSRQQRVRRPSNKGCDGRQQRCWRPPNNELYNTKAGTLKWLAEQITGNYWNPLRLICNSLWRLYVSHALMCPFLKSPGNPLLRMCTMLFTRTEVYRSDKLRIQQSHIPPRFSMAILHKIEFTTTRTACFFASWIAFPRM